MPIEVDAGLTVPDTDYSLAFIRASGPGGQNVNKVASAVPLRFDLAGTRVLDAGAKQRLGVFAGQRLTDEGSVLITARNHRTQEQNRREAERRLSDLIRRARIVPKPRKPTRPTRASKRRRVDTKVQRGSTKRGRGRVGLDD